MTDVLALLRPAQWVKNAFVLAPLVFSQRLGESGAVEGAGYAFVAFCLASSTSYVINDIVDRERDRAHPLKSTRPVAAGRVSVASASALALVLALAAAAVAATVGPRLLGILCAFLALQIAYSLIFKSLVVVDVAAIAGAFVLRAAGGVVAVGARMSAWLFVCTFMLAMFLALGKRRHELALLKAAADDHREVLGRYTMSLLDMLIGIAAITTILVYTMYALAPDVAEKLGTDRLYYTVPFVVFGVFRYLFLIYRREQGGSPTDLLLGDLPLQSGIAAWSVVVLILLYR